MNQPEFPTVFRGYDPVQVDAHLAALHQAVETARQEAEAARQEAAESSVELSKTRQDAEAAGSELEAHRSRIAQLEDEGRKVSSPTFADLGERIGSMLGLADEEASSIRSAAAEDADQTRRLADEQSQLARAEADTYAEEVRNRADTDAAEVLSRAKAEADSIVDDAAREAAARREEAEAYFEKQRATAAAQAADFEKTLGERRDAAAAEFNDQIAKQDQALLAVQERADLLAREAEEDHQAKTGEAGRLLEAARTEAADIVRSAKEQADRVRRDSERELAAATARRDSITAQLSNVRNMLATLGGPAAAEALAPAEDEVVEESAETGDERLTEDGRRVPTLAELAAQDVEDEDADVEEVDEEVEPEDEAADDVEDELGDEGDEPVEAAAGKKASAKR
ncbi:DivIVA domain-containing protein [Phycicoccus sp. HDW14]|uniref:DivIVA domain-containing protein n=1 Tax=Phycicoccus sp. HDW14 TaxID=2714941 RepID=UPI001409CB1A|nr:DivIVA domain-containing protein [Phycicoccus sp. HDW14]QIM21021.1 DivIVA domain-containing protein [Phycicoccus sp. HDW14]